MCGICGVFFYDQARQVDARMLEAMTTAMATRGPDGEGFFIDHGCGLGHRRLSIIDVAGGAQPMVVGDSGERCTIVFNGEIYNYRDLTNELKGKGHRFSTNSDTEAILHAYREWGTDCVAKLQGMFGFALWDERRRSVFIARDRLGIKPLYYHCGDGFLVFASEVKSILATGLVASQVEMRALDAYFSIGYVPAPLTMFAGILKLQPGHWISVDKNGTGAEREYWDLKFPSPPEIDIKRACRNLEQLLEKVVASHLMSEVPLGVFLSGGLDSSAITALASVVSPNRIRTFSVGYEDDAASNELPYARKIADAFETEHHEFVTSNSDFFSTIPLMVAKMEEPVVETAAIPLFHISRLAKPHATVLLSGEGSDEIFAGYGIYQKMLRFGENARLPFLLNLVPQNWVRRERILKYLYWMGTSLEGRYRGVSADLTPSIKDRFYQNDFIHFVKEHDYLTEIFQGHFAKVKSADTLSKLLYVDMKTWLVDDLLTKADKMTMATSVELRVPFLDHKVVELAATISSSLKIHDQTGKYVLKKTMEGMIPDEIIHRKKMGFPVPTKRWFGGQLLPTCRDALATSWLYDEGVIRKDYVHRLLDEQGSGKEDHSRRIFSLLIINEWHRQFVK